VKNEQIKIRNSEISSITESAKMATGCDRQVVAGARRSVRRAYRCYLAVSILLSGSSGNVFANPADATAGTDTAARCGYDLTKLAPVIATATFQKFSSSGLKISLVVKLKNAKRVIGSELTVSCLDGPSDSNPADEEISDAQTVIQEEDAGGRYFRHVASQRMVKGANWRATVATVDYVLGDSQKVSVNEFLACDADALRPCISVRIDKPSHLSRSDLQAVYDMIGKISLAAGAGHQPRGE
jgi:hypothetical protein